MTTACNEDVKTETRLIEEIGVSDAAGCDSGRGALEQALAALPLIGDAKRHFDQIEAEFTDGSGIMKPLLFIGPVGVGKTRTAEDLAARFRPSVGFVGRYSPVELGSAADCYEPTAITKEMLVDWTKAIREDSGFLNGGRLLIFNDIEKIGRPASAAAKALRAFLDAVVTQNRKVMASGGIRSDRWLVILTSNIENEAELGQLIGDDGRAVIDRCVKYYFGAATEAEVASLLMHESLGHFNLNGEGLARIAAGCGGSFRRAISNVLRLEAGLISRGAAESVDYLHAGLEILMCQFGLAIHGLNELKAEAEKNGAESIGELIKLETSLVECQEWLGDIAAKRQAAGEGSTWARDLEELTMRLSPCHSLGALMRRFQKTVRDSKWASEAARKKHAKAKQELQLQETSAKQMEMRGVGVPN